MNGSITRFNFRAKAVLCMTLVAAMHVVVGCGGAASLVPPSGNLVELTPDHPLARVLAGTPFSGATAFEVNAATNQFRLVFPDGSQQISGTFSYADGKAYVSRLTVADGTTSATLTIGANQQITSISTSAGPSWQRPGAEAAKASLATAVRPNTIESYLAANADLLAAAQEYDAQGTVSTMPGSTPGDGNTGEQTVKTGASLSLLAFVFGVMIFIPLGVAATIIFLIELVVVVTTII